MLKNVFKFNLNLNVLLNFILNMKPANKNVIM